MLNVYNKALALLKIFPYTAMFAIFVFVYIFFIKTQLIYL